MKVENVAKPIKFKELIMLLPFFATHPTEQKAC